MRTRGPILAAVVGSLVLSGGASARATTHDPAFVLATARSAGDLPRGAAWLTSLAPGLQVYRLRVPAGRDARAYARQLQDTGGAFAAQPDMKLRRTGIAGSCAAKPDPNTALALPAEVNAATLSTPSTDPIAVLDTGVDPATPELAGRVLPGVNATDGSANTADDDGHGTEVASVAAAAAGRFAGISPTSPIFPVRIYTPSSETTAAWVVKGIAAAANAGAAVINFSSSNPLTDVAPADASVAQQAISAAFDKGTLTVVSAGNEGKNVATVPGSFWRVLDVGSASADGTRDPFSNFGPWLDLMSPGANLTVPIPPVVCPSGFGVANGTSFSAPAVAGGVALIKALRPKLSAQQLYDVVRLAAVKDLYSTGRDDDSGFGLLNVAAGVNSPAPIAQPTEVDDDVYWLRQDPKKHPTYLKRTRSFQLKSAVESGKDPQDVFPVYIRSGQTLTVGATSGTAGLLSLGVWSPKTGPFDIGKGRATYLLADSAGVTSNPLVSYRARRSGTYFVSVEAPDIPDPSDPSASGTPLEAQTKYTLKLRETKASSRKKKKG